jgi:hypothetical protein
VKFFSFSEVINFEIIILYFIIYVALNVSTDVSEEYVTSIFRVEVCWAHDLVSYISRFQAYGTQTGVMRMMRINWPMPL